MVCVRWTLLGLWLAATCWSATFGTVVPVVGGLLDIVLDEARNRLYLVNPTYNRIEVYAIAQRRFLSAISVDRFPISAALSRNGKYLYVTCYDGSSLNAIDLDSMTVARRISLPAKPEGVAVGADDRVLITTIGTGPNNQANTLLLYDPSAAEGRAIGNVVIATPPAQSPRLPPPSGRLALAARSRLAATPDGSYIVGLTNINNNTGVAFVYESASASVIRSRQIGNISTVLSVAPDGSKFMAGLTLFDTETLTVLAQQNAANAPFPFQPGAQFSLTDNIGGSVFSPDGAWLFSAFNIPPLTSPPTRPNVSQLLINDPDNLLIHLALQLTENVAGKMVIASDGTIYALSESGFMILPLGRLNEYPLAMPEARVVLLANDQCGVVADQRTAAVRIQNLGRGRLSITPQLLQIPQTPQAGIPGLGGTGPGGGAPGGTIIIVLPPAPGTQPTPVPGAPGGAGVAVPTGPGQQQPAVVQTAPLVRVRPADSTLEFVFNANAARSLGTITPHNFVVRAPEAINLPPRIRVLQNNRDAEARADIVPIEVGISDQEGLVDLAVDTQRRRLYIANSGLNRVEVFDMRTQRLLEPIKVGQLPRSLALSPDGNTLYVANSGGESISIVDLNLNRVVGRVRFPALPFNASAPVVTPSVIAAGLSGLQIVMSNGTLWQVIGNEAVPRPLSPIIGSLTVPAPRTMAATPNGEYILLVAGANNTMAYLYDAMADEYVVARQLVSGAAQGFLGPVAAGPRGQYYVVNGMLLNQSLTRLADPPSVQVPARAGQTATMNRPVAAVAPVGTTMYARFMQPLLTSATALASELPVVELVDANTGMVLRSAPALEAPLSTVVAAGRAFINGRTMALDPNGQTAYVLTTSGLSIVPLDQPRVVRPTINRNGVVNMASYTTSVAPGGLISIFGQAMADPATASATPLPSVLGGSCVTVNNRPLPLLMTSPTQINAQLPPDLTAGRYTLVIRSVDRKTASASYSLTVSRYAPAVFVDPVTGQAAIYHPDGSPVTKSRPAKRDQVVTIYATGLGATKGGRVVAGMPAPSEPLAVTDPVKVFFGDPSWQQSEMIVEWSGLMPGAIGVYQINVRVPGFRMRGDELPVTIRIGGVNSPSSAPVVPKVAVE